MTALSSILALFSIRNNRIRFCRFLGIYMVVTAFSTTDSYELKDIACNDVMEETVDLHQRWFSDQAGVGRCLDKHGMEYQGFDTVRSCSGCLTFQCVGGYEPSAHRNEYFWNISSEYNVDKRCCKNCEGKVYPEGTEMGIASTEEGKCTTEVKTTCLYNPANGQGEITEDHSLKDCCLDSEGLHQIATIVMDPDSCSMRECRGVSKHRGHSSPYWVTKQSFPDCNCCHLDGSMIPPGGWILSNKTVNLTCCEGKLLATTTSTMKGPGLNLVFELKEEFNIAKGFKLGTLPYLGKQYKIQFEWFITGFGSSWQSIILFTTGAGTGDENRIPGVWLLENNLIEVHFAADSKGGKEVFPFAAKTGKWMEMEISQYLLADNKVEFDIKIDGTSYWTTPNSEPQAYTDVKMLSGDTRFNALNGKVRNFQVQTKND